MGGQVVVRDGRILTVDEAALRDKAQAAADRLREVNRDERLIEKRLAPIVGQVCRSPCAPALSDPAVRRRRLAGDSGGMIEAAQVTDRPREEIRHGSP